MSVDAKLWLSYWSFSYRHTARSYVMVSLLKKLQELHTNGPAPYNHGICTQV